MLAIKHVNIMQGNNLDLKSKEERIHIYIYFKHSKYVGHKSSYPPLEMLWCQAITKQSNNHFSFDRLKNKLLVTSSICSLLSQHYCFPFLFTTLLCMSVCLSVRPIQANSNAFSIHNLLHPILFSSFIAFSTVFVFCWVGC